MFTDHKILHEAHIPLRGVGRVGVGVGVGVGTYPSGVSVGRVSVSVGRVSVCRVSVCRVSVSVRTQVTGARETVTEVTSTPSR